MDYVIALSRQARHKAQRLCVIQNFWNGLGASFVIGDIIALIALFYNAGSMQMALLFAALYITFPAALLAPKLMSGVDCSAVWRWMWVVRTLMIPLYFIVPLLPGAYQAWAVVAVYFGFCSMRSIGVSASVPVLQSITSEHERPAFMGKNVRSFTIAYALVVVIAYAILKVRIFENDEGNYQLIIALGLLFSLISCAYLFFLPETGRMQKTSFSDIVRVGVTAFKNGQCRRVIVLMMFNTLITIFCGYSVPYMKEIIGLDSGNVVLMSVIGLAGAIVATQMLQIIGRRISSWGLLLGAHLLIGLGALFFTFAEPIASAEYMLLFAPAVVLIYFGRQAGIAIMLKVQADAIPQSDRYTFSAIFQLSGVVSSIVAIGYIKVCEDWLVNLEIFTGNKYIPIFVSCALLCLLSCIVIIACHGALRTGADLKLLAPRSLYTFIQMHMLNLRQSRISKMHGFENLMAKDNSLSRSLVMEFLESDDFYKKNAAIRTLYMQQIDRSRPYLIAEMLDKQSPFRDIAVTALGLQKPDKDNLPTLLEMLEDPSGLLRANAVKTLLRQGYAIDAQKFMELYAGFTDNKQKMNALVGVSMSDRVEIVELVLRMEHGSGDKWLAIVFQLFSDMFGSRTEMMELIDALNLSEKQGLKVLEELIGEYAGLDISRHECFPSGTHLSSCCSKYLQYLMQSKNIGSSERNDLK